jgi:hypothetical protein
MEISIVLLMLLYSIITCSASKAALVSIHTELCADKCQSDCRSYQTPLGSCYNPQILFPNDVSWADVDVFDMVLSDVEFKRSFFRTTDGSCASDATDIFQLRVDECVGPFGKPRPWGNFSFIYDATPK